MDDRQKFTKNNKFERSILNYDGEESGPSQRRGLLQYTERNFSYKPLADGYQSILSEQKKTAIDGYHKKIKKNHRVTFMKCPQRKKHKRTKHHRINEHLLTEGWKGRSISYDDLPIAPPLPEGSFWNYSQGGEQSLPRYNFSPGSDNSGLMASKRDTMKEYTEQLGSLYPSRHPSQRSTQGVSAYTSSPIQIQINPPHDQLQSSQADNRHNKPNSSIGLTADRTDGYAPRSLLSPHWHPVRDVNLVPTSPAHTIYPGTDDSRSGAARSLIQSPTMQVGSNEQDVHNYSSRSVINFPGNMPGTFRSPLRAQPSRIDGNVSHIPEHFTQSLPLHAAENTQDTRQHNLSDWQNPPKMSTTQTIHKRPPSFKSTVSVKYRADQSEREGENGFIKQQKSGPHSPGSRLKESAQYPNSYIESFTQGSIEMGSFTQPSSSRVPSNVKGTSRHIPRSSDTSMNDDRQAQLYPNVQSINQNFKRQDNTLSGQNDTQQPKPTEMPITRIVQVPHKRSHSYSDPPSVNQGADIQSRARSRSISPHKSHYSQGARQNTNFVYPYGYDEASSYHNNLSYGYVADNTHHPSNSSAQPLRTDISNAQSIANSSFKDKQNAEGAFNSFTGSVHYDADDMIRDTLEHSSFLPPPAYIDSRAQNTSTALRHSQILQSNDSVRRKLEFPSYSPLPHMEANIKSQSPNHLLSTGINNASIKSLSTSSDIRERPAHSAGQQLSPQTNSEVKVPYYATQSPGFHEYTQNTSNYNIISGFPTVNDNAQCLHSMSNESLTTDDEANELYIPYVPFLSLSTNFKDNQSEFDHTNDNIQHAEPTSFHFSRFEWNTTRYLSDHGESDKQTASNSSSNLLLNDVDEPLVSSNTPFSPVVHESVIDNSLMQSESTHDVNMLNNSNLSTQSLPLYGDDEAQNASHPSIQSYLAADEQSRSGQFNNSSISQFDEARNASHPSIKSYIAADKQSRSEQFNNSISQFDEAQNASHPSIQSYNAANKQRSGQFNHSLTSQFDEARNASHPSIQSYIAADKQRSGQFNNSTSQFNEARNASPHPSIQSYLAAAEQSRSGQFSNSSTSQFDEAQNASHPSIQSYIAANKQRSGQFNNSTSQFNEARNASPHPSIQSYLAADEQSRSGQFNNSTSQFDEARNASHPSIQSYIAADKQRSGQFNNSTSQFNEAQNASPHPSIQSYLAAEQSRSGQFNNSASQFDEARNASHPSIQSYIAADEQSRSGQFNNSTSQFNEAQNASPHPSTHSYIAADEQSRSGQFNNSTSQFDEARNASPHPSIQSYLAAEQSRSGQFNNSTSQFDEARNASHPSTQSYLAAEQSRSGQFNNSSTSQFDRNKQSTSNKGLHLLDSNGTDDQGSQSDFSRYPLFPYMDDNMESKFRPPITPSGEVNIVASNASASQAQFTDAEDTVEGVSHAFSQLRSTDVAESRQMTPQTCKSPILSMHSYSPSKSEKHSNSSIHSQSAQIKDNMLDEFKSSTESLKTYTDEISTPKTPTPFDLVLDNAHSPSSSTRLPLVPTHDNGKAILTPPGHSQSPHVSNSPPSTQVYTDDKHVRDLSSPTSQTTQNSNIKGISHPSNQMFHDNLGNRGRILHKVRSGGSPNSHSASSTRSQLGSSKKSKSSSPESLINFKNCQETFTDMPTQSKYTNRINHKQNSSSTSSCSQSSTSSDHHSMPVISKMSSQSLNTNPDRASGSNSSTPSMSSLFDNNLQFFSYAYDQTFGRHVDDNNHVVASSSQFIQENCEQGAQPATKSQLDLVHATDNDNRQDFLYKSRLSNLAPTADASSRTGRSSTSSIHSIRSNAEKRERVGSSSSIRLNHVSPNYSERLASSYVPSLSETEDVKEVLSGLSNYSHFTPPFVADHQQASTSSNPVSKNVQGVFHSRPTINDKQVFRTHGPSPQYINMNVIDTELLPPKDNDDQISLCYSSQSSSTHSDMCAQDESHYPPSLFYGDDNSQSLSPPQQILYNHTENTKGERSPSRSRTSPVSNKLLNASYSPIHSDAALRNFHGDYDTHNQFSPGSNESYSGSKSPKKSSQGSNSLQGGSESSTQGEFNFTDNNLQNCSERSTQPWFYLVSNNQPVDSALSASSHGTPGSNRPQDVSFSFTNSVHQSVSNKSQTPCSSTHSDDRSEKNCAFRPAQCSQSPHAFYQVNPSSRISAQSLISPVSDNALAESKDLDRSSNYIEDQQDASSLSTHGARNVPGSSMSSHIDNSKQSPPYLSHLDKGVQCSYTEPKRTHFHNRQNKYKSYNQSQSNYTAKMMPQTARSSKSSSRCKYSANVVSDFLSPVPSSSVFPSSTSPDDSSDTWSFSDHSIPTVSCEYQSNATSSMIRTLSPRSDDAASSYISGFTLSTLYDDYDNDNFSAPS
ncbi:serine-rich adhesin for platelets-like isoform X2 [Leucoraja erinacea]|uniref:serine-rich adhesin for platelets-like isoform X2 n=1 Tax=Leucoraja erinaceus TaxID=7782 RepID=UPI002455EC52|nr:serine-rich adhesin for platelets-like isoform X2 [Leucoraja erinacea]